MRGKQLLKQAFALKETIRVPWVPFVGVHAASLLGITAEEYLKSTELIVKGVTKAIELYNPDGIPIVFDLQLEAECLGCGLVWANENPPAVHTHPLMESVLLEDLKIPATTEGRIAVVMEATRQLRANNPDLALYGLITGPFTLGLHLLGTDIFLKMFMDEQYVHKLMEFCTGVCIAMTNYYKEAGCDVIAVVDPMTSQIGADQFEQFVTKYCTQVFDHIKVQGMSSSFFVCGHAQHNIEVMCACKPDNISIDENIPLEYVKKICLKSGISFGGNLLLTSALLLGTPEDCERNAVDCMDIGGNKGYIMSPGCDLAYATPRENLVAVTNLINDEYRRDVIRAMEAKYVEVKPIDKTAYGSTSRVIIDVITLDSSSCAPCQYMLEAAKRACEEFGDKVICIERSIKTPEGLEFLSAIGAKNIPTLCIDGAIAFVSNIPPINELKMAIENIIKKK
ncbi:MAG: uroporphyrinogen decarboxylase family protein [Bacteroidales bacterium]|nr:uroporphyrinogen decarboxylase family protein [Bacteroidales bacterium]